MKRYLFGYGVNPEDVRPDDIPVLRDCYSAEGASATTASEVLSAK